MRCRPIQMKEFFLPYGRSKVAARLEDRFKVELIAPTLVPPAADPAKLVREALARPLGNVRLEAFGGARAVAIAVNDKTRPVPHAVLLPPLLERLAELGIPQQAITLIIATGLHAPMKQEEFPDVLPPEIVSRYRVVSHDAAAPQDLVERGKTGAGTRVIINRLFAQADLRIVVGNLEPHQFMGFSGGVKTAAIGLAGRETIEHNHAMMLDPRSDLGRYDDNPARQDVEEIGGVIGVHFVLNDVINEAKQIVYVLAGEPRAVMESGIPLVRQLYAVSVPAPYDLMIVSPGGHPKDINLYQAQKALAHAARVTPPGGTIILVAACPEGTGSRSYEQWVSGMPSQQAVIDQFKREGFRIGPHKAFQIARDAGPRRVLFVTEMPPAQTERLLLKHCTCLDEALALGLNNLAPDSRIGIMPFANATMPEVAG
jgi:lactate racemase